MVLGIVEIIGLLSGLLKFWDQVAWLIKTLQKTPEEKREGIMQAVQKEADAYSKSGRPTWG